ncbi:MAG: SDR family NAD(P)-dependent oxidoreductase, partial [Deltaproteobacteria bacterium]|nr:SDR family NAD(P)-dependent oxidoreductase [Deltaproteobacteria bacterium]
MNLELAGKRVLVSGATRGIGRAIATLFASEGARVAAVARGAEGLDALKAELAGEHAFIAADVATPEGAADAVEGCLQA